MPVYEFDCTSCSHEWEDILHHADPIPAACPECQQEGTVRRLISLPSQGKVELTGSELKAKLKAEGQALRAHAKRDQNFYANLIGESTHESNLAAEKKADENRPKIKMKKSQTP